MLLATPPDQAGILSAIQCIVAWLPLIGAHPRRRGTPNGESAMSKLFSILKLAVTRRDDHAEASAPWLRDPLQHPDLARMAERELADLPFPGWPWPRAAAINTCDGA
jgi:hypothetical protein